MPVCCARLRSQLSMPNESNKGIRSLHLSRRVSEPSADDRVRVGVVDERPSPNIWTGRNLLGWGCMVVDAGCVA
jgi:hypothetical protein